MLWIERRLNFLYLKFGSSWLTGFLNRLFGPV
ncbi:hypothetical protein Pint_31058 [Pistacia integerrima]|uniref:Uncharacterized protein n=1 Tax=Pistacia integerrima TaxID=434235 RepID=A0ACC0XM98_9ROSI|nr:hypothetical protein Pint_31058 [Pistacia integerrima]